MSTIDQQVVLNILKRNGPLTTHGIAHILKPESKGYDLRAATSKCHARCVAMIKWDLVRRIGTDDEGRTIWEAVQEECRCQP